MIPIFPASATSSIRQVGRATAKQLTARLTSLPPLTLYIHFPWCAKKCPYCDFNSHEHADGIDAIPQAAYVDALIADLDGVLPQVWGRRVHAVFIGGGTPSLMSPAALDRLMSEVRARLVLEADAEITLEANPGTVEAERFAAYRALGINRLSLGIQSFDDRFLTALGRIHDGEEAKRAVEIASRSFENFNLDLMYALPGQTAEDAGRDVAIARGFGPAHLSLYQLTLEPNTVFAKYPPRLPDEDVAAAIEDAIGEEVTRGGWKRYEVSAYAQPGRESRHNLNYWNFGDYIGIGAGAHAKLSFPDRIVRQTRVRNPAAYLDRAARALRPYEEIVVGAKELPFEFMLNAMRLVDGVPHRRFEERTGISLTEIEAQLAAAEAKGLMGRDAFRLWPTPIGLRFLNDLQSLFLPASPDDP
ncbi:MAG: radical SAM family heme chaperone HemW [Burkholderiaceae bacterium]